MSLSWRSIEHALSGPVIVAVGLALATDAAAQQGGGAVGGPSPEPASLETEADRSRCTDAFDRAQSLRDEHRLLAAREALSTCADPRCPGPLRKKCLGWLPGLADDIPTVVVSATDDEGRDVLDARALIDGAPAPAALSGAAVELDPGPHTVRIERQGSAPVEQHFVLAQGHKNRRVEVRLATPARAPGAARPRAAALSTRRTTPRGAAGRVALGVAGVGLAFGAFAGGIAFSRSAELAERCPRPGGCSQSELDTATALAHASTVGFALGGVGAVSGVLLLAYDSPAVTARTPTISGLAVAGRF